MDHTDACDYLRAHVTKGAQGAPSITELQPQQIMQAIAPAIGLTGDELVAKLASYWRAFPAV